MDWIKNNLISLIILVLFLIILGQTCRHNNTIPITHSDTVINNYYTYRDSVIINKPTIKESKPYEYNTSSIEYLPDTALIAMVKELKQLLNAKNRYIDTFKVDTIGTAILDETIENNKIAQRKIKYNLTIPSTVITITNNIPIKLKNEWFIGGGIGGNQSGIKDFNAGLALKRKNNQLYELKGRIDLKGNSQLELNTFWKIH